MSDSIDVALERYLEQWNWLEGQKLDTFRRLIPPELRLERQKAVYIS
jgi:hypothetical protein